MRRLPWRSTLRANRKGTLTAIAVSLITAFALAGFSLAALLEGEAIDSEGRFAHPAGLVMGGGALGAGETRALVKTLPLANNGHATVAWLEGAEAPDLVPGTGAARHWAGAGQIEFASGANLMVASADHVIAPRTWIVVHAEDWSLLVGNATPDLEYRLVPRPGGGADARAPGIAPFMEASGREVGRDLFLVVAFSCALVALFSYEFMASEVRERRREIAVWRSLGMRRREVRALILGRAGAVSAVALVLGVSQTLLLLTGAARMADLDGLSLPSPGTAFVVCTAVLASGVLGAIGPADRASRIPVREALEAPA